MNTLWIVAHREFTTRVRKRSFLIMTILGPVFFGLLLVVPALLTQLPEGSKKLLVVDHSFLLTGERGVEGASFQFLEPTDSALSQGKAILQSNSEWDGLLYLPPTENGDPDIILRTGKLFATTDLSLTLEESIESLLEQKAYEQKLRLAGVDPSIVKQSESSANITTIEFGEQGREQASATGLKMALGLAGGFFVYIFVFLYATQIMRGVIEEKTSRIVEVIISSVKPFQLMLGKIIGIAGVGFLQFFIWVGLSGVLYVVLSSTLLSGTLDPSSVEQLQTQADQGQAVGLEVITAMQSIDFPLILSAFLFYFIGGYLLYGALFAAVGSAVDAEADTQQFMLPLTLPLILSIIVATKVMESPGSPLAFWFSIIPFTSPVVMMIRLPFGVPAWELALSMIFLVLGFLGTTWIAARVYRIGILLYGKKLTYKELWKWIRSSQ